jgi:hypothetical protein
MRAKITGLAIIGAMLGFVWWRIASTSHAQSGPVAGSRVNEQGPRPTPSQGTTVRASTQAAAPIGAINAAQAGDPLPWEASPLLLNRPDTTGKPFEEWRAEEVRRVMTVYRQFVADAHLADEQKKKFDQIVDDTRKMLYAHFKRVEDKNLSDDEFGSGQDEIKTDAYQRIKLLLSPDQYEVFRREIGGQYFYVVSALEHVPR